MKIQNWVQKDLVGGYNVDKMPKRMRPVANNILKMIPEDGWTEYESVQEMDKKIMWRYWEKYDRLPLGVVVGELFKLWFVEEATYPEMIRRTLRQMEKESYILIKADVRRKANESGEAWRLELGSKGGSELE